MPCSWEDVDPGLGGGWKDRPGQAEVEVVQGGKNAAVGLNKTAKCSISPVMLGNIFLLLIGPLNNLSMVSCCPLSFTPQRID